MWQFLNERKHSYTSWISFSLWNKNHKSSCTCVCVFQRGSTYHQQKTSLQQRPGLQTLRHWILLFQHMFQLPENKTVWALWKNNKNKEAKSQQPASSDQVDPCISPQTAKYCMLHNPVPVRRSLKHPQYTMLLLVNCYPWRVSVSIFTGFLKGLSIWHFEKLVSVTLLWFATHKFIIFSDKMLLNLSQITLSL